MIRLRPVQRAFSLLLVAGVLILAACGPAATGDTSQPTSPAATDALAEQAAPTTEQVAPTTEQAAPTAAQTEPATNGETSGSLPAVIQMPEQIAEGRPVAISVIGLPPETQPEARESWLAQAQRFMERYPNVTINGSDYVYAPDTFPALVAGNQVPTLFEVYLTDPSKIIDQAIAADLTAFYQQHNLEQVFNPQILAITSQDSQIYGIPVFAYGMGLAYNIPMLEAAGFDAPPATWDELATVAQKLTLRDEGRAGFSFITDGSAATGWHFTTIAYGFGAKQSDIVAAQADGSVTAAFASGAPAEALEYIKQLRWTLDVLPRENLNWGTNAEALATGRAAMVIMAGDQFNWIRTTFPDVDMNQFGFAPLPAGPDGNSSTLVGGNIAMVSSAASPDEVEAAVYFRLWTQFDPAEIQSGLELSTQDPAIVVGAPVLPLYVGDYQQARQALQEQYANLPIANYQPFIEAVSGGKVTPVPELAVGGQEYYAATGAVVSTILTDQSADPGAQLTQAAQTYQSNVLDLLTQN